MLEERKNREDADADERRERKREKKIEWGREREKSIRNTDKIWKRKNG